MMRNDLRKLSAELRERERILAKWHEFLRELDEDGAKSSQEGENTLKLGLHNLFKESVKELDSEVRSLKNWMIVLFLTVFALGLFSLEILRKLNGISLPCRPVVVENQGYRQEYLFCGNGIAVQGGVLIPLRPSGGR